MTPKQKSTTSNVLRKANAKNMRSVALSKFHRPNVVGSAQTPSTLKQSADTVNKRLRSFLSRARELDVGLHRVTILVKKYDGNTGKYEPCISVEQRNSKVSPLHVDKPVLSAADRALDAQLDALADAREVEVQPAIDRREVLDEVTTLPLSQLVVGMNATFCHVPWLSKPDPYAFTAEEFFMGSQFSKDASGFYVPMRNPDGANVLTSASVIGWLKEHLMNELNAIQKCSVQATYIVSFTPGQLNAQIRRGMVRKLIGGVRNGSTGTSRCTKAIEYVLSVGNLWIPVEEATHAAEDDETPVFEAILHECLFKAFMPR